MFPVELHGEKVTLTEYHPRDAQVRFAYFKDPEVYRYQTWEPTPNLEDAVQRVEQNYQHAQSEERREYVLAVTVEGRTVGEVGLLLADPKDRGAHVFYTLARGAWGRGYASEAAILTVRFGFERLQLHRICAQVHPNNAASIAIANQKLGMQFEGTQRHCEISTQGEFFDMNVYATLATDPHSWDGD